MNSSKHVFSRRDFLFGLGAVSLQILSTDPLKKDRIVGKSTCRLFDEVYSKHETGEFHYETAQRLSAIYEGLEKNRILPSLRLFSPRRASLKWIERVHSREYIDIVRHDAEKGIRFLSTKSGNTALCRESFEVALYAAGGLLTACDVVISGRAKNAFCAIRPPGHHASSNRGMGYCLFNNTAIAARYLQEKYGLERILIVDWDVHHGNGTQDIFYEDGSVFFFSTHQWPWYPWTGSAEETGSGKGRGTTLNVPLPAGTGNPDLIAAFENMLFPAMENFKPEFILISAGFDSRTGDPLGRFRLTDDGFKRLTKMLLKIADYSAGGRLVSALEGGYSLEGLSKAVPAHIQALLKG